MTNFERRAIFGLSYGAFTRVPGAFKIPTRAVLGVIALPGIYIHPSSSRPDFFLSSRSSPRSFNPTPDPPSSVLSPTVQTVLRGLPPVNDAHSQHFALAAGHSSTPRPRMPRGPRISG
ncbi:hypothetical protein K438DRAFT_1778344 [Mycena galopus ATCC 62051]|nr:hypothetical protein K438DRAFT_1778344 [Mycena galopus ATCC 62051]